MKKILIIIKNFYNNFKFIIKFIFVNKRIVFFISTILVIFNSIVPIINSIFPAFLIDNLIQKNYLFSFKIIILYFVFLMVINHINHYLSIKNNENFSSLNIKLNSLLVEKSMDIKYETLEKAETQEILSLARKSIANNTLNIIYSNITEIITAIISIFGVFYILKIIDWYIKVLFILIIILNCIFKIRIATNEYKEFADSNNVARKLEYARFWLPEKSRAKEVRSFNLHNFVINKLKLYNNLNKKNMEKYMTKNYREHLFLQILNFIQIIVLYGYGLYMVSLNKILITDFILYISCLSSFLSLISGILSNIIDISKHTRFINNVTRYLDIEESAKIDKDINFDYDSEELIKFENVSFIYENQKKYALKNINLTIKKNEKIAIVGSNGAGKTTFIKLLLGLYRPTNGKILFKNININNIDFQEYSKNFSAIFQDFTIFNFSIAENISLSEKYNKDEIEILLKELKINKKYNDYITQMYSNAGIDLSGGEQQKIALARAIYYNKPIIILDEPTSALSPQSENDLYEKFKKMVNDKNVFFISHRLSSCILSDKIIVFKEGSIVEVGTHRELIRLKGEYYSMYKSQSELYSKKQ